MKDIDWQKSNAQYNITSCKIVKQQLTANVCITYLLPAIKRVHAVKWVTTRLQTKHDMIRTEGATWHLTCLIHAHNRMCTAHIVCVCFETFNKYMLPVWITLGKTGGKKAFLQTHYSIYDRYDRCTCNCVVSFVCIDMHRLVSCSCRAQSLLLPVNVSLKETELWPLLVVRIPRPPVLLMLRSATTFSSRQVTHTHTRRLKNKDSALL